MPSRNGPSARALGILLPGFRVRHPIHGEGTVIIPSHPVDAWPKDSVFVRWDNHGQKWALEKEVTLLQRT